MKSEQKRTGSRTKEKERSNFWFFALYACPKPKVDPFDPDWKGSKHVADNVLDSLVAICLHSCQKMAFMASKCCFW